MPSELEKYLQTTYFIRTLKIPKKRKITPKDGKRLYDLSSYPPIKLNIIK